MFKKRNKIGSSLGLGGLDDRILRLLRSGRSFAASLVGTGSKDQENVCVDSWKEIRNALLEAEYKEAQALMAFQQNKRRFC